MTTRTKRRYAAELYPHPGEDEIRPLAVEVPYLYAQFIGLQVWGTDWSEDRTPHGMRRSVERITRMVEAGRLALIADALHQDMVGEEAWRWANERVTDDMEFVVERAEHYGVPFDRIKPYEHNQEPAHHDHHSERDTRGWRTVTRVDGRESECPECTEEVQP